MKRREFGKDLFRLATLMGCGSCVFESASASTIPSNQGYAEGLLLGGLIGDALGGPIEFLPPDGSRTGLVDARTWKPDRQLTLADLKKLSGSVPLLSYRTLRPQPASYGPWEKEAPAGTLTDDSRHKIVLIRAIQTASKRGVPLTAELIAKSFLAFEPERYSSDAELQRLTEEGLREYRYAARWLLGERDPSKARPLERLWAGVNNCSGQMLLPPLALAYAGEPEKAYRKAFEINFVDAPQARDMASSLVAGLAELLSPKHLGKSESTRWEIFLDAMRDTDPFRYRDVPFAGRPLNKWLDTAEELATQADRKPKELYRLLETEGKPVYWWDAHFTLLVPLSMMHFCDGDPLAALHLTLDFGHDTDSYAQVLGCIVGAIHGSTVFPAPMIEAVQRTLRRDYDESTSDWIKLLTDDDWSRE